MVLTYLECALQDEEFEYFWRSVRPSVQNLKFSHAVKRPKAVGLDGPKGPDQYIFTCLTICQEKSRNFVALSQTVQATDRKNHRGGASGGVAEFRRSESWRLDLWRIYAPRIQAPIFLGPKIFRLFLIEGCLQILGAQNPGAQKLGAYLPTL